MSSIFSTETNNIESLVFTSAHGLQETATPTAYGLGTDNAVEGSAIAPSLDPLLPSKNSLEGQSITASDPLLSEFIEDGAAHYTTAIHTDDITGMHSGEIYSQTAQETASTSRVSGSLDFWDDFNPTRQGAFKDDYTLSSGTTTTVQVNLGSNSFDTFLQLVDFSTGEVLAQDDDGDGTDTNSQLIFTAQAGQQYTLRVTSYYANAIGGYDLTAYFNDDQPTPPDNPAREFSSVFGYGLVDAAAAVAAAIGQSPFSEVPDSSNELWNNHMINAPEVWNQGFTGEGITVAVIDSGVDIFHDDLRDNIWQNTGEIFGDGIDNDGNGYIDDRYGWNFGVRQNNPDVRPGTNDPGQDHGTHVAGTIAAGNNGFGMTGVAYNSNIMAIRMGDIQSGPTGGRFVNGGDLAEAIRYAVDNGADVINMSIGWGDGDGRVRDALAYAAENNVIAVSASGNEGESMPGTPARYATDYGISVGSLSRDGIAASSSNQAGSDSRMHHVMAPGVDIVSTTVNNNWNVKSGTSMAAPHVAGVVALMLSANRNLTHDQVRSILTGTTFSTNTTTQTTHNTQPENWPVSVTSPVALPSFERWYDRVTEGEHYIPANLATSTLDDANLMLSGASSTNAVYEFLLEQSEKISESYALSWQHELTQPLFDSDLLTGVAA